MACLLQRSHTMKACINVWKMPLATSSTFTGGIVAFEAFAASGTPQIAVELSKNNTRGEKRWKSTIFLGKTLVSLRFFLELFSIRQVVRGCFAWQKPLPFKEPASCVAVLCRNCRILKKPGQYQDLMVLASTGSNEADYRTLVILVLFMLLHIKKMTLFLLDFWRNSVISCFLRPRSFDEDLLLPAGSPLPPQAFTYLREDYGQQGRRAGSACFGFAANLESLGESHRISSFYSNTYDMELSGSINLHFFRPYGRPRKPREMSSEDFAAAAHELATRGEEEWPGVVLGGKVENDHSGFPLQLRRFFDVFYEEFVKSLLPRHQVRKRINI